MRFNQRIVSIWISLSVLGMVGLACNWLFAEPGTVSSGTPTAGGEPAGQVITQGAEVQATQTGSNEPGGEEVPKRHGNLVMENYMGKGATQQPFDILPFSDGQVWVADRGGIYINATGSWISGLRQSVDLILGQDSKGRVWVLLEGGKGIASFDGSAWVTYGAGEGWLPLKEFDYLSPGVGDSIALDGEERVWIATGKKELRRLDPKSRKWITISAEQAGFTTKVEEDYQGHFLTDVARVGDAIWTSDCIGQGEVLVGQGIRQFHDGKWTSVEDTQEQCVYDMEVDPKGKVWVGAFDALMAYDSASGVWERYPLPKWDRKQLVAEVDLDPWGRPWILVWRGGAASLWGTSARYHLEKKSWVTDLDTNAWLMSRITFATGGKAYLCAEGIVYLAANGKTEKVGKLDTMDCSPAWGQDGTLWIAAYEGPDMGLWKLSAP